MAGTLVSNVVIAGQRIVVQVPSEGPTPPGQVGATFHAARLAGIFGDRLLLDVAGLGEHMFFRSDGRWASGPSILLDACVLDFGAIDAAVSRDAHLFEWVPGTQPTDAMSEGYAQGTALKAAERPSPPVLDLRR